MNNCFYFLFFLSSILFGQIIGQVKDDNGDFLPKTNIIILDSIYNVEYFTITDDKGFFKIDDFTKGNKIIQIKKSLFSVYEEFIIIDDNVIDLGIFTLVFEDEVALKEVIVTSDNSLYKKDTTTFESSKYRTGKEFNIEDLIRNLPGASVDKEGNIKIGKKDIEKVLVDGDDLFERGYALLTQSMSDKIISKIQIINNYTKNELTKGIYNSDQTVINLVLDEKAKDVWNGSILASSSSYIENMHQLKINLMNFSKKQKIFTLFNYNNVGFDEMKAVGHLINNQFSNSYNFDQVGINNSLLNVVNLYQENSLFEDNRTNFNNDKIGLINFLKNSDTNKLQILTIYNNIQKNNYTNSIYQFNDNSLSFTNNEAKKWNKRIENYFGKIEWNKVINNKSNFNFINRSYIITENNKNNYLVNNIENDIKGLNQITSIETQGIYTLKLNEDKLFVLATKHLNQKRPYDFTEFNPIFSDYFNNGELLNLNQKINYNHNYLGIKASFINKFKKNKNYNIQTGVNYSTVNFYTIFKGFNEDFSKEIVLNNSENSINFNQIDYFLIPKFESTWKNFILKIDLPINILITDISKNINNETSKLYFSPKFELNYEKIKLGQFSLAYTYNPSPYSFIDFFQNMVYKGNRSFEKSLINQFDVIGNSQINFRYSRSKNINDGLDFNFIYKTSNKTLGYNYMINQYFSTTDKVILKGNEMVSPSVSLKKFFYKIKSKIQVDLGFSLFNSVSIVNNNVINNQTKSYDVGLIIKSGFSKLMNYEIGSKIFFNTSKNDINYFKNENFELSSKVFFVLSRQTSLNINYELFKFGGQNQSATNFLDVNIFHQIKNSKIKLFVKGNNLLNNRYIKRTIFTPTSKSIYTQELLPLHILIGTSFNF